MKQLSINSVFSIFSSYEEISNEVQSLFEQASLASQSAYAPYSNFKVGAAILLENGKIIIGSNQENAAYPSGLCAERVAIFQASTLYPNVKIKTIALTASLPKVTPCGACRQALLEYEINQDTPIEIYFENNFGEIIKSGSIKNLLPFGFHKNFL